LTNDSSKPLLADVREELGSLGVELREMAAARLELARLEIAADLLSAKRLTVAWAVALVMLLTSLPLVAVWMADVLSEWTGVARGAFLLGFAGCLLLASGVGGHLAWRRFRRNFVGLRETLEELQEDLLWLKEKTGASDAEQDAAKPLAASQ
jgi:uncharacterized membrane protein YqjE